MKTVLITLLIGSQSKVILVHTPDGPIHGVKIHQESDEKYGFAMPTDDQWHLFEFRVKMNDVPGNATGGLWKVWMDGGVQHAKGENIMWVAAGDSLTPGWNWINAFDNYIIKVAGTEWAGTAMKIFMDDIVIYTPIDSADPLWLQSPQDGRLPLNYTIGVSDNIAPASPSGLSVE